MKYYIITIISFLLMTPIESKVEEKIVYTKTTYNIESNIRLDKEDSAKLAFTEELSPLDFSTIEIEQYEGCTDYLVYPGGFSGPTIACGLDLGNAGFNAVSEVLRCSVSDSIYNVLIKATSIRGEASREWIRNNQVKLGRKTAMRICNKIKMVVWRQVRQKYPNIENAPEPVKSAILDIAFHAGVGSKRMAGFGKVISQRNWNTLGVMIANSYSDFEGGKFNSIHQRRVDHGKRVQYIDHTPQRVAEYYD